MSEDKNPNCPCSAKDCPRNANCKQCREYHHSKGNKTACERQ